MTKENKILISKERLSELGEQLNDLIRKIEMQNHVINFIPNTQDVKDDPIFYYNAVYNALDSFFDSNQDTLKILDNVSFILQSLDNKEELQAIGEKVEVAE